MIKMAQFLSRKLARPCSSSVPRRLRQHEWYNRGNANLVQGRQVDPQNGSGARGNYYSVAARAAACAPREVGKTNVRVEAVKGLKERYCRPMMLRLEGVVSTAKTSEMNTLQTNHGLAA